MRFHKFILFYLCLSLLTAHPCAYAAAQADQVISGTAFAVSPDGHLLTAYHVVKRMQDIYVEDVLSGQKLKAQLVASKEEDDLALLWVQGLSSVPGTLSKNIDVKDGQVVFVIGYSGEVSPDEKLTMTTGVISASQTIENPLVFKHTAEVMPGQSGGAVFSDSGEIIGMVLARMPKDRIFDSQVLINNSVAIDVKPIQIFLDQYLFTNSDKSASNQKQERLFFPEVGATLSEFTRLIYKVSGRVDLKAPTSSGLELKNSVVEMLKFLSSDMRRKFFGAYVAGYKEFVMVDSGVLLLSTASIERPSRSLVKARVIISFNKPQSTSNGAIFFSSINDIYFKCDSVEMAISRKEYKKDAFGVGETIHAVQLRSGKELSFKPIVSPLTRQFFETNFCKFKENQ